MLVLHFLDVEFLSYIRPLLKRFWDVCLLRKGPEDVPYSIVLLLLTIAIGLLLDSLRVTLLLPEIPTHDILLVLLLHTAVMLSAVAGLLYLFGYRQRIVQSVTALSGTGVILTLLILPLDYITGLNPERFSMISLFMLMLHLWGLIIAGHILSRALSVHRFLGVIIAFGYLMLGVAVFENLLTGLR